MWIVVYQLMPSLKRKDAPKANATREVLTLTWSPSRIRTLRCTRGTGTLWFTRRIRLHCPRYKTLSLLPAGKAPAAPDPGEISLGCALCTKINRVCCAITSLTGHFKRYCRILGEEALEKTRQMDHFYYRKNRKSGKKV